MIKFEKVSFEQYYQARWHNTSDGILSPSYMTKEALREEYDAIKLPQRSTDGSAGYDFYSPVSFNLIGTHSDKAEEHRIHYELLPTGIRFVTDNKDVFLMCVPRSGNGFKYGFALANTCGVIDSDYQYSDNEGHIMAKIYSEKDMAIEQGKAFMQGIILPYYKVDDDNSSGVRNGGFGSTDAK